MVIGNGGSTVTKMMADTGTIIKFSPGRECYPGTSERVCIVTGRIEAISNALQVIFDTLLATSHPRAEEIVESLTNFKMLVSNIASGMVIGKSGSTIKGLKSEFGVNLQVSSKDENSLPERTLTITGDRQNVLKVISRILTHTIGDPESSKWKRLTRYSKGVTSQASTTANSSFSGGIGMPSRSLTQSPQAIMSAQTNSLGQSAASLGYGAAAAMPNNSDTASQFLAFLQQQQQQAQVQSMLSAFQNQKDSFSQAQLSYAYAQSLAGASSYYSKYNPVMVDGVNLQVPGGTVSTMEMAIPEVMATTVANAQMISDVKQSTGVRIELTGKGEYIPGTYNRKLTLVGPILSVQAAHMIFTQKIIMEQERFQKQGLL